MVYSWRQKLFHENLLTGLCIFNEFLAIEIHSGEHRVEANKRRCMKLLVVDTLWMKAAFG